MRKLMLGVAAALGCLGAGAAPAVAADACTPSNAAIAIEAPDVVNAGKAFAVEVESFAPEGGVSAFALVVDGVATAATPASGDWTTVDVLAPARLGSQTLVATWEQAADPDSGAPACSGRIERALTVVARNAVIGFTEQPRVDGPWTMFTTPLNFNARTRRDSGRVVPRCAVGACAFRIGSGYVWRTDDGVRYEIRQGPARPTIRCVVLSGPDRGRTVLLNAYFERFHIAVRTTRSRRLASGFLQATRLEGIYTYSHVPTGAARAKGCRGRSLRSQVVLMRGR